MPRLPFKERPSDAVVVLAVGAVRFAGESLRPGEIAGIGLIIAAVTLFGLSGMSVDLETAGIYEQGFLLRLTVFTAVASAFCAGFYLAQRGNVRGRGVLRTLNAGLLLALSSLWLGVLTELLRQWIADRFALTHFPYILLGSAVVTATSLLGIAETQRAFAVGDASKLIPIQNVPAQILPVAAYFLVFHLRPGNPVSLPLCLLGAALVLFGAALLAGRQELQVETIRNS